nr:unnamed protein product [Callosobruchus analis]
MGLASYYMQNMPVPQIPVQEMFYYRQLWVCAFEIHNIKKNTGHFYTYYEGQGQKGPNEGCTSLNDYIMKPPEITELYLFSDGCDGSKRETYALSTRSSSNDLHSDTFKLLKGHKENPAFPNKGAYNDPVTINEKKLQPSRR